MLDIIVESLGCRVGPKAPDTTSYTFWNFICASCTNESFQYVTLYAAMQAIGNHLACQGISLC